MFIANKQQITFSVCPKCYVLKHKNVVVYLNLKDHWASLYVVTLQDFRKLSREGHHNIVSRI